MFHSHITTIPCVWQENVIRCPYNVIFCRLESCLVRSLQARSLRQQLIFIKIILLLLSYLFIFMKIIFIFLCSGMFRDVPEYSVFRVLSTPLFHAFIGVGVFKRKTNQQRLYACVVNVCTQHKEGKNKKV